MYINSFFFIEKYQNDLMNLARTTLSSKILAQDREFFAEMAVRAIMRQGKVYFKKMFI